MEVILRLLIEIRLVLIAVAGICCAAFLFTGLSSLRELRRAVFRLERSTIISNAVNAWVKAGLCAIIGLVVWVVTSVAPDTPSGVANNPLVITPTMEVNTVEPTPVPTADLSNAALQMTAAPQATAAPAEAVAAVVTVDPSAPLPTPAPVALPTETPSPVFQPTATAALPPTPTQLPPQAQLPAIVIATATPTVGIAATAQPQPTLAPPPTPTETAPVPATGGEALVADCPHAAARIDSPIAGETVSGIYVVRGTADFPGGVGRYKLEILRPNIPGWAFLWENYNAVKDGVLMPRFDSSLFPPGVYTLRLSLVDAAGQDTGIYCSVQIRIA